MIEVQLHSWGDTWTNQNEVISIIYNIPATEHVIFHTMFEGISLKSSGILDVVNTWVATTSRDPSTVKFNTPNQYEKINYRFDNYIGPGAHFFGHKIIKYNRDYTKINQQGKLFGLFIGRYNPMRNIIAKTILDNYITHSLISIMKSPRRGANLWWDPEVEAIGSLDGMTVRHQYNEKYNTNQSLLQFYNDFQIEIVTETVTLGESFFPTEKTVRPIMGSKPFLTYAPINYLANLRNIGFRTFSELWSEEYDQYEGNERWNRMKLIFASIIEQGYDCDLAQDIVQYNYTHLQKIIKNGQATYQ